MRTFLLVAAVALLAAAGPAAALDKIRITAAKKTVDKRQSSQQALPHGSTSLTEKQVIYNFTLQRMAPDAPETLNAAWVLIEESMDGRLREAARGDSTVVLPLGRSVNLETAAVGLDERTINRRGRSGSVSSDLAGYGLRLLNDKGDVVAERIEPPSLAGEINWDKAPESNGDKRAEIHRLQQMLKADERARREQPVRKH